MYFSTNGFSSIQIHLLIISMGVSKREKRRCCTLSESLNRARFSDVSCFSSKSQLFLNKVNKPSGIRDANFRGEVEYLEIRKDKVSSYNWLGRE